MLLKHVDPEFGDYIGPWHRAEILRHRRARFAGRRRGMRAATTRDVYGGLLGLSDAELAELGANEGVV